MTKKTISLFAVIVLGVMAIYFAPYIILGENAQIKFLTCVVSAWIKVAQESGAILNIGTDKLIPNMMNGIPRSSLSYGINFLPIPYSFLPFDKAYLLSNVLMRLIGALGMFLLLKDFILVHAKQGYILLICLVYSIIPLGFSFGIGIIGQPLLLWAFLNIQNSETNIWSWIIIALFPFWSIFPQTGIFICFGLMIFMVIQTCRLRRIPINFLIGLTILSTGYIISNFHLINNMVFEQSYISMRYEWDACAFKLSVKNSILFAKSIFTRGYYEASKVNIYPILLMVSISLFLKIKEKRFPNLEILFFSTITLISLFAGFYEHIKCFSNDIFPFLSYFQVHRFSHLLTLLHYVALAYFAHLLLDNRVFWLSLLVSTLIAVQVVFVIMANDEVIMNTRLILDKKQSDKALTLKSYHAEKIFENISTYIGKEKSSYRVMSIGMWPDIALYNGFYVLDLNHNNYPLSYKREFRKIIEPELNKDDQIKMAFDDAGDHCYIIPAEIGKRFAEKTNKFEEANNSIQNLDLNIEQFKKMGGKHIFSAVEILNYSEIGLKFEKKFTNDESYWNIYLYSVV